MSNKIKIFALSFSVNCIIKLRILKAKKLVDILCPLSILFIYVKFKPKDTLFQI